MAINFALKYLENFKTAGSSSTTKILAFDIVKKEFPDISKQRIIALNIYSNN